MQGLRARLRPRGWWVLWAILGLGLALRIGVMVFYTPTVFSYYGGDSARYMRLDFVGIHGLFGDNAMPAGYPAFLAALRAISSWLPFTTIVQHLLGLGSAALLYAALRRVGVLRWAALLPAAVIALSGNTVFLEHAILTEALWMPTVILGMCLAVCSISAERPARWLAAGGAVLACAALIRNMALLLPVLVALWAALALPGSPKVRLRHCGAVLLPALLVVGAYLVIAGPIAGGYSGISQNQGVILYGRVAQFAECSKFTPPEGTERLCVDVVPPNKRPGALFWKWGDLSPLNSRVNFDSFDSNDQAALSRFAWAAILHQPLDYIRTVSNDFVRFFAPEINDKRLFSGTTPERMSFSSTKPVAQKMSANQLARSFSEKYSGVGSGIADPVVRSFLGSYQLIFGVYGPLLLLFTGLSIAGWVLGRGAMRAGASLFSIAGLQLLLTPALIWTYDFRFGVLPASLLVAGAAFGLSVLVQRIAAGDSGQGPLDRGSTEADNGGRLQSTDELGAQPSRAS